MDSHRRGRVIYTLLSAFVEMVLPSTVWIASSEGNAQAVTAWLDEGGGVDASTAEYDATLLIGAAGGGWEASVRMLVQSAEIKQFSLQPKKKHPQLPPDQRKP